MKNTVVAVIEPQAAVRRGLVAAVQGAGFKVSDAEALEALSTEPVVLFGPGVPAAARAPRKLREDNAARLLLRASEDPVRRGFADAVVPLPLSRKDFALRLPELLELHRLRRVHAPGPAARPGAGIVDPLTQFYTYAHFREVLHVEARRARRYGFPLSVALLAFDALPGLDMESLAAPLYAGMALAIRRSLRDTDFPVRYSGSRVLLLMPHTDLPGGAVVARRIVERVARASLQVNEQVLKPTVSAGVSATVPGQELSFDELLRRAESALQDALAGGGNAAEFYSPASEREVEVPQPDEAV
jgi:diguanylate cyclase (GGDEF)-like protein